MSITDRLYDKSAIDFNNLLFNNKALKSLLIPLIVEQLLNSMMGIADTMMVTRIGEAAISAVSNVDSFNTFILQIFTALAAGAAIVCSQHLGKSDIKNANIAAGQVIFTVATISLTLTAICTIFNRGILNLIYGSVNANVMSYSRIYFFITALSYPFLALFNALSAFFRVCGNSKFPMKISVISNFLNIGGNAVLIFVFKMGVAGAALSTLLSRVFLTAVLLIRLKQPKMQISIGKNFSIKPILPIIASILAIGIPAGIEGGMLQFGKLAIQSSISTLTTTEMSAHAMTNMMESMTSMFASGVGLGIMTIVGHTLGAGRLEEAKYYIVKLTIIAYIGVIASCLLMFALNPVITLLSDMSKESAELCFYLNLAHITIKILFWPLAFIPAYGLRAAGDVKFCMINSTVIMWTLRVGLCIYLIRSCGIGPIAVWISFGADWFVRAIMVTGRFLSGKWTTKKVI